jgi:iron complex outermembrane receptor protein
MLGANKNGIEWMTRLSHKRATNYQNKYDGRCMVRLLMKPMPVHPIGIHHEMGYSTREFLFLYDDLQGDTKIRHASE